MFLSIIVSDFLLRVNVIPYIVMMFVWWEKRMSHRIVEGSMDLVYEHVRVLRSGWLEDLRI